MSDDSLFTQGGDLGIRNPKRAKHLGVVLPERGGRGPVMMDGTWRNPKWPAWIPLSPSDGMGQILVETARVELINVIHFVGDK